MVLVIKLGADLHLGHQNIWGEVYETSTRLAYTICIRVSDLSARVLGTLRMFLLTRCADAQRRTVASTYKIREAPKPLLSRGKHNGPSDVFIIKHCISSNALIAVIGPTRIMRVASVVVFSRLSTRRFP